MKRVIHRVLLAGFLAGSATLVAAPFDGNKPMLCATQSVIQCDAGADCVTLTPESVNVPDFFQVDAGSKLITTTPEAGTDAKTAIERSELRDGKLMLQGADDGIEGVRDGLGWTMAINDTTGKMVLTASGDSFALVVFGACTLR